MHSVWTARTIGLALVIVAGGGCANEPDTDVGVQEEAITPAQIDAACTGASLNTTGTSSGKTMSLASAPPACNAFYTSTSNASYGATGCDGYIVELTGVEGLPRAGEAMRMFDSLNPKLTVLIGATDCAALTVHSHAYVHTTGSGWIASGAAHNYVGSWTGQTCDLVAGPGNGEIQFPATPGRDKIRLVTAAKVGGNKKSVALGVNLGTCAPPPRSPGTICDTDDQCASGLCALGSCCGSSAAEKRLCIHREALNAAGL